jgi:hypothetical protein
MATYSQHHTKWRITETFPVKVRKKTGLSTFFTPLQYSFGISIQSSKAIARNERDLSMKGRSQIVPICR